MSRFSKPFCVPIALVAIHAAAAAQSWPQQPVKLVVGFAAGGPSDIVARAFADQLGKSMSQTVIVETFMATAEGATPLPIVCLMLYVRRSLRRMCGVPGAPAWLRPGGRQLVGCVSLSAAPIERAWLPKAQQRNRPDPVPAVLLGQLAVDARWVGAWHVADDSRAP